MSLAPKGPKDLFTHEKVQNIQAFALGGQKKVSKFRRFVLRFAEPLAKIIMPGYLIPCLW